MENQETNNIQSIKTSEPNSEMVHHDENSNQMKNPQTSGIAHSQPRKGKKK